MDPLIIILAALLIFLLAGLAIGIWGLLLSRSAARARIKDLDAALAEERTKCADLRTSLYHCSETHLRAINELGRERDEISGQLERCHHQIRVLSERPDRREMARLRACQDLVRRLVVNPPDVGSELAYIEVLREGRLILIGRGPDPDHTEEESEAPATKRSSPVFPRFSWMKRLGSKGC
jgi:hypothetical protein